ncbi:MAG TPA: MBL fold metallo-hydrolase [Bauldia sp.]|nr:MBL fold metallo-hydrolase [Bauldia sp.]
MAGFRAAIGACVVSAARGWQPVLPDIDVFHDSCNVYAVGGPSGTVFVNAGTGHWLDGSDMRFRRPYTLLLTHFFRDHAAGAAKASRLGFDVRAPAGETAILADPAQHFRERQSYIVYDNIWDQFVPIEPARVIPVHDYDPIDAAGLTFAVMPLPGVTPHHTGYALTRPDGRTVVFSGEAIHSPGRMARIAPLQYDYNDLGGAVNAHWSIGALRRLGADSLLPSLGTPILHDADAGLALLEDSLRRFCALRPLERDLIVAAHDEPLERVTDHVWVEPHSEAASWYVLSDSGKALVIDYGYRGGFGLDTPPGVAKNSQWPSYPMRSRRRVLLHGIDTLRRDFGVDRIDVVLLSHFHDDHVAGVPLLRRLFGTECWAPENFAELLVHPEAHRFPCDWPEPLTIDRRLPLDRTFAWEEYTFRLAPMSGHTRFAAAIMFEADGKRFVHTGDQHFFDRPKLSPDAGTWQGVMPFQNEVYRNGCLARSFRDSAALLAEWRPDIVISGHCRPMYTDDDFFRLLAWWGEEFERIHREVMVLGDDETHFDADGWGGWIWPYRLHIAEGEPARVTVTVRNPMPEASRLTVRLVGPEGWEGSAIDLDAAPRAEVSGELIIRPSGPCRRQPIAAELLVGDRSFGQVAEALVTVGGEAF